jgi:hypothetical protein
LKIDRYFITQMIRSVKKLRDCPRDYTTGSKSENKGRCRRNRNKRATGAVEKFELRIRARLSLCQTNGSGNNRLQTKVKNSAYLINNANFNYEGGLFRLDKDNFGFGNGYIIRYRRL